MKNAIETKVDKLIEYIYACSQASTTDAAEALGVPVEQIEEWAKPLEDSEMIQITYSPIHGMMLNAKPLSDRDMKAKFNEFKDRKDELKKQDARLEKAFARYGKLLPGVERRLKELERRYDINSKNRKQTAKHLEELKSLHTELAICEDELSLLQQEKSELNKTIDHFKRDIFDADKRAEEKTKDIKAFYDFLSKAEKDLLDTKQMENRFIAQMSELRKRLDNMSPHLQAEEVKRKKLLDIFRIFRRKKG